MAIESKYKQKVIACIGGGCPIKATCKLWHNLSEHNIMEKIRPPFKLKSCTEYKSI